MNIPSSRPRSATARVLGVALVAGALTQLILTASAGAKGDPLEAGKPALREIRKGETHVYEVFVPPDRLVNGVVDQRGVDLMVRIVDPTGATIATVDSPNGKVGPEPWSLDGKTPGTWRLEVSPFPDTKAPGRYEARVDEIITLDERDERLAKLRYSSPRLLRLWKERRADGAAAIDRLVKEMDGHAPLVEPVADDPRGDVLITFLRRVPLATRYVELVGGPTVGAPETPLSRFEGTELAFVTLRSPNDARFTYQFCAGEPLRADATRKEMDALHATAAADPWNPRRFMAGSLVELPAAPAQTFAQRVAGVPAGHVVERTIHSAILGEDRKLGVYLPAGFDPAGGPYPYVILFDGDGYWETPPGVFTTPTILDNLIAQGKVPPMLAVLVDTQGTRARDLPMSAPFGDFLAKELAPWVRREYRAAEDPSKVTLAGQSFGGLCAAYCAFHHPDVFGNALSQSGSFWFSPGALTVASPFALETGALMREIVAAPPTPVRVWMEVGLFEGSGALAGSNQVAQNRHMRDVLLAKGYRVSYHEYVGGHDYVSWRGSLADGLIELCGANDAVPTHP
jgi:enterochelin esterase-like enzyme